MKGGYTMKVYIVTSCHELCGAFSSEENGIEKMLDLLVNFSYDDILAMYCDALGYYEEEKGEVTQEELETWAVRMLKREYNFFTEEIGIDMKIAELDDFNM
jgi:hypothetical protein